MQEDAELTLPGSKIKATRVLVGSAYTVRQPSVDERLLTTTKRRGPMDGLGDWRSPPGAAGTRWGGT